VLAGATLRLSVKQPKFVYDAAGGAFQGIDEFQVWVVGW